MTSPAIRAGLRFELNLLLFTSEEAARPLPLSDPRATHILAVLQRRTGDSFDAGLINGPRGRGTLLTIGIDHLSLAFAWGAVPPPPDPLTLIVGLPRPQTARDILRDATTLGVTAIHFVLTEKGETNYAQSSLWTSGEWRRHLLIGAAQAFDTHLPEIIHGRTLAETVAALPAGTRRLALDNYEATTPLGKFPLAREIPVSLALGPERGWSAGDRLVLRKGDFLLAHLGSRVLRCETAVIAALMLVRAARDRP